jgi:poly-beta-1,6-N-acetyl-D-glucosamine synthase
MMGWRTWTFQEKTCRHHRPIGTGAGGKLSAQFRQGKKDHYVGGHPVWELFRAVFQMTRSPYVAGGACLLAGYISFALTGGKSPVSAELRAFHRREQLCRLRRMIARQRPISGG